MLLDLESYKFCFRFFSVLVQLVKNHFIVKLNFGSGPFFRIGLNYKE